MKRRRGRPRPPPDPSRPPQKRAVGLAQDARAYWQAAQIIEEADAGATDRGALRLLTPGYFLASHAIELTLKAYLLSQGTDPDRLLDIGHDLDAALAAAEAEGFDMDDDRFHDVTAQLSQYHREHWFRYRAVGLFSLPLLGEVIDATESALDYVEPIVRHEAVTVLSGPAITG